METSSIALKEKSRRSLRQILGGRYLWLLLLYSVSLVGITGAIAAKRHLWWDEIEVYYVITLPDLKAIWHTLLSGVDWQPPTYYFPLYYLCKWFGASSLVMRSIAIFPYWLATLILYVTVARRTTPLHGFLAMLFPSLTLAFSYAFEARPYALVLLFTACTFLAWDLTHEQRTRRFALPALALSLGAAFAVHYNACLVALAPLAGEAVRASRRRALDVPILLAVCCGALPGIFLLPHLLTLRHFVSAPSSLSLVGKLSLAYNTLFAYPMLLLFGACALLAIWFAMPRKDGGDRRISAADFDALMLAASGVFLVIPIAFCAISYFSHTYYPRYVLETVIGAAIFLALLLHGVHRAAPRLASVLLALFLIAAVFIAGYRLHTPDERDWGTFAAYSDLFDSNRKALDRTLSGSRDPLVLGQGPYLLALRYGDEELRSRAFHLLSDAAVNVDSLAWYDRMFYRGLEAGLPAPSHLADYDGFKRQYRRFLLYNPDTWLMNRLLAEGQDVKIRANLRNGPLYSVVLK